MRTLNDLAREIDAASDAADETLLRQLANDCESRLVSAEGQDRVFLLYYQSNAYAAIISFRHTVCDYTWSWEQSEGIQNILLLRRAISEPAFDTIDPERACQIRTNLGNRLSNLGRPVAANEQWLTTLSTLPRFAKALANRAHGLSSYARTLYDYGHTAVLAATAKALYDAALHEEALWESADRDSVARELDKERKQISSFLSSIEYDTDFDLNQWSLGSTAEERSYRRWCLQECLFLNPLNEACKNTVAATDVLHLPNHTYSIAEVPRFPAYYNLMKQEYVSSRFRLYRAIHKTDPDFLMHDVLMLDSGEAQCLGHYTEDLRASFRASYSIFDKIALFMNDYFSLGLKPKMVTFRSIWFERPNSARKKIRAVFEGHHNLPLRGLYFLSKDLHDTDFMVSAEPDAYDLARLRHQLEHRFLSLQIAKMGESTETHRFVTIQDFENKSLRLLKLAREALIYLSLAVHREETLREERNEKDRKLAGPILPRKMVAFQR